MSTNATYILGVDDEPTNRMILEEIFENQLEFVCVDSGQACLDSVAQRKPDLILLDVSMPGMNGLEVCKTLRADSDSSELPIIFVSALGSADERLAGYEAGGDDYITKPFVAKELKAKVEVTVKQHKAKKELKESSGYAMQTAMTAMTSAAELGLIVRFLQDSFNCKNVEELANKAFECVTQYDVEASLIVQQGEEDISIFSDNVERPLETAAVELLRTKGRIFTHGNKIIFNGIRASLLIKNLPDDDDDKVGRLRDHFAVLLDGLDARLESLEIERELAEKQKRLSDAIKSTQVEIMAIDDIHRNQQVGVVDELSNIAKNVDEAFMTLGLTSEQEDSLMGIITQAEANTEVLYSKGVELDKRFNNIISQLKSVL